MRTSACWLLREGAAAFGRVSYHIYLPLIWFTMNGGCSKDDDTVTSDIRKNLLDEAYSAAAYNVAALQSALDGMDEALVAEVRKV
jgi:hypothetical protein